MHPFFVAQAGDPIMSHNGATVRHTQLGTRRAFRDAFAAGYRWFQIDAIAVADDLLSAHSVTGRRRGWFRRTRDWFRLNAARSALSTVREVVFDPAGPPGWNSDTRWNIEMKDARGLPQLRAFLAEMARVGRLDHVLVSSPWRPKVLREVAQYYPTVAIAAPIQHGGVFGVTWWPWGRPNRPYDCEQVHRWFVRRRRRAVDRPHQQAWTIRSRGQLDKLIERTDPTTGATTWRAWPIVDSRRLTVRPLLDPGRGGPPPPWQYTDPSDVAAVALGGGGWRGAFGGIGTIAYLLSQGAFEPNVEQVVGISGGAFTVAGLAGGTPSPTVGGSLSDLLDRLVGAARQVPAIAAGIVVGVLGAFGALCVGIVVLCGWRALTLAGIPIVAAALFAARLIVIRRWSALARRIYLDANGVMPVDDVLPRRYAIGATGLNDGRLYSFSSSAARERTRCTAEQWPAGLGGGPAVVARERAVPLGGWNHAEAVVRASSLPGIGPRAGRRIWLPCPDDHATDGDHSAACEWVPDRLVDGGLNGIFGRGLLLTPDDMTTVRAGGVPAPAAGPAAGPAGVLPVLLTVDTGRALVANNAETWADRLAWWGQRISVIFLEARWLQVAFNISYLAEMGTVYDGAVADGFRLRLVRLAETETDAWSYLVPFAQRRRDLLQERLFVLRDRVHTISLIKARREKAYDAITCAAVACALEFQGVPNVTGRGGVLRRVEDELGLPEGVLVERWNSLKVPMLGQP